jgi:OOP family OmpA-OmpF porin
LCFFCEIRRIDKMTKSLAGYAAVLGIAAFLSGCQVGPIDTRTWNPDKWAGNPLLYETHLRELRARAPQAGGNFPAALAAEYRGLAESEAAQYDWIDSDHFAVKGLSAAGGSVVLPDTVESRYTPTAKQAELGAARQRLLTALDGGARDRAPALAARAQSRYDCWLEQQEENWQIDDIAACRSQFLAAMNDLEVRPPVAAAPPPAGPREFRVYFDFDKSTLTPEGQQIVNQVAQLVKSGGTARLELVGKADRSGPDNYNQRLSERRARTVQDALTQAGVPRDRLTARGVGEKEPPVPTPDGVREPRNRVVEISIR